MTKSLKPRKVDFTELTRMLEKYERKFGYSTIEFFHRYSDGKLGDDDEFMMWLEFITSISRPCPFVNSCGRMRLWLDENRGLFFGNRTQSAPRERRRNSR